MRITKNYCCMDCGGLIAKHTALYSSGQCRSCVKIIKNKITRNYCCKTCGYFISKYSAIYGKGQCAKCWRTILKLGGINHPSYKDGRCLIPHLCIECGKPRERNAIRCLSCFKKFKVGKNHPTWTGGYPKCLDCGKLLGHYNAKRCGSCRSKKRYKDNPKSHPWYAKPPVHNKWLKYNDKFFRSGWEANFAKWLDLSGIKWDYEPKTFDLGNTTYTPDFYLSEFDCWIEIKGWFRHNSKKKFTTWKKVYKLNYLLLREKHLKRLGII
jgi:hypothetical protein